MPADPERIGVSPYLAPLPALHVVPPGAAHHVERLALVHRAHGWQVTVAGSVLPAAARELDVVVLHGLGAARARAQVRGVVPTVVLAGASRPAGPGGLLVERLLARWTSALVVSSDAAAEWWARRVPVPLTRLRHSAPDGSPDPDELAAILVRTAAWGVTTRRTACRRPASRGSGSSRGRPRC